MLSGLLAGWTGRCSVTFARKFRRRTKGRPRRIKQRASVVEALGDARENFRECWEQRYWRLCSLIMVIISVRGVEGERATQERESAHIGRRVSGDLDF